MVCCVVWACSAWFIVEEQTVLVSGDMCTVYKPMV